MATNYGINDIETLSFKDGVRKRIAMYLGSADMQGVYNSIQEIISNSIDEFYMGFGKEIKVSLNGNTVTVQDFARGVPFGTKTDGTNVLVDIYSKPHTGGKFNDKVYNSVAGLNGIGAKATCLSSKKFEVISIRDGKRAIAVFEKGNLVSYNEQKTTSKETGTTVTFTPDEEVYNLEPVSIEFERLCNTCKNLSYLTKGLTFSLEDKKNKKKVTYCAKNGLLDLIADKAKDPVHEHPIYYSLKDGQNEVEIALQWTKGRETSFVFTNGLENIEGGTSLTGLKTAITRNLNKEFKRNFSGEMARTGLVAAISCKTPNPSFANQTKTKINNPELRQLTDRAFSDYFKIYVRQYAQDAEAIKEFLSREEKAEEAADRARAAVINAQAKIANSRSKKTVMPEKLKDAEFLGDNSMLLIVEGNSAMAGLAAGRDTEKYGLLAIRGKIRNLLSCPLEEGLENEEVQSILTALGCGILDKYDSKKLRYGKVGIAVDADDDGCHIACLIMSLFRALMPEFVEEGRLCWLKAPLYKVQKGKTNHFFYNDEELIASGIKGEQIRYKGLGEMGAADVKESMFSSTNQRVEVLIPDDNSFFRLEELMGPRVEPRKEFVFSGAIDFSKIVD
jgi:DNA gyrase subunit B